MTAVTLHRIDPARNMSRILPARPEAGLVRHVGRRSRKGTHRTAWPRIDPYPTEIEAAAKMQRQRTAKQGRGYVPLTSSPLSHVG